MYALGRLITSQMKRTEMEARAEIEKESFRQTTMEEITSSSRKRRKITHDLSFSSGSAESLSNSDTTPSHNFNATDLKGKNSGTEVFMFSNGEFSGEKTSSSGELCIVESEEVMEESSSSKIETERKISLHKSLASAKTPPAAEIEEFFSAAEMYEQKQFSEKYNYDIVKDIPLEGRYNWVRLKL